MTEILTEQMRSLVRRLDELDAPSGATVISGTKEILPSDPTKGNVVAKQLADILGLQDVNMLTRAMTKLRQGRENVLTRQEMAELSIAFMRLVLADPTQTNKAMMLLKRISANSEK